MKPSVALIGMRGSGKSTVGRELAARLNLPFIDTDELITHAAGRCIADIFAHDGEIAFRRLEPNAVRESTQGPAVISVGGGAVLDAGNVSDLRSAAMVVWLTAPVEVLCRRLEQDTANAVSRPALTRLTPADEVRSVLAVREPLYRAAADFAIDTASITPGQVAEEIARQFERVRRPKPPPA